MGVSLVILSPCCSATQSAIEGALALRQEGIMLYAHLRIRKTPIMASLSTDKNKNWTIQFVDRDGKRKSIRLCKMDQRNALSIKTHIEYILSARSSGLAFDQETSKWIASLSGTLAAKLTAVGLIDAPKKTLLREFVDDYVAQKEQEVKPGTLQVLRLTQKNLTAFFGPNVRLAEITAGDAEDFRRYLTSVGLGEATNRKRCSVANQILRYAQRHRLIDRNPFEEIPKANLGTEHLEYVSSETARKVLSALRTTELKVLFAMSRWGGLRVGSEVRELRWDAIDWKQKRIKIVSPKTARYRGRGCRTIPLFPELEPLLRQWRKETLAEEEMVLPMLRGRSDASLRKYIFSAIGKSGVAPWKRLWHNLRSSRQTELEQTHPTHVVCAWLGNSESIAKKHYLQVTDQDYQKALQNAVQQPSEIGCITPQPVSGPNAKCLDLQGIANQCDIVQNLQAVGT